MNPSVTNIFRPRSASSESPMLPKATASSGSSSSPPLDKRIISPSAHSEHSLIHQQHYRTYSVDGSIAETQGESFDVYRNTMMNYYHPQRSFYLSFEDDDDDDDCILDDPSTSAATALFRPNDEQRQSAWSLLALRFSSKSEFDEY